MHLPWCQPATSHKFPVVTMWSAHVRFSLRVASCRLVVTSTRRGGLGAGGQGWRHLASVWRLDSSLPCEYSTGRPLPTRGTGRINPQCRIRGLTCLQELPVYGPVPVPWSDQFPTPKDHGVWNFGLPPPMAAPASGP